ncbi:MAG: SixA phosphatase family protein, partial [Bryobacteraceae bacterium]
MEIYLLRHGIAEESTLALRDSERRLTPKGKTKLRDVLDRARRSGVKPTLILSSPLVRARETADIAAEILGCRDGIVETESLVPGSTPERVWSEIREHRDVEQV